MLPVKKINDLLSTFQKVHNPDKGIKEMLPKQLKDILAGRRSCVVHKTRQFFQKFTDCVYRSPGEELWEDLLRTKCYLDLHILLFVKNGDKSDDCPITFFHAELPEIMLEMIEQSFNSDFFIGSAKMRCVPSLAISVMTSFMHMHSETFLLMSDKFFRDSELKLVRVSEGALDDKLTCFDKLTMVQFYGVASYCRMCKWFLFRHSNIVFQVCTLMYHGMEIIEEKIRNREINWQNETLACSLTTFRDDDNLILTSRLLGIHTTNQAVVFFKNVLESTTENHELYQYASKSVMKAEVLKHFPYIVKQIMTWFDPGLYLNHFLTGVKLCLGMGKAIEHLLMENLTYTLEHKLPVWIDTFKFWNHETKFPNTIAWFLLHSLTLNKKFGSNLCIFILCHVLSESEDSVVDEIVKYFGLDLIDLAHLVEISSPKKTSVQSIILEAILRYGRIQHKVYNYSDIIEGELKLAPTLKEYIVEAILFCKKVQCEAKMSLEKKQRLVFEADEMKKEGNAAFKSGNYMMAIIKYTDAIALCPLSARKKQAIYYSNRAECHLRSKNPRRAIHDCNRALCLDTAAKQKVQWRRSRAYQKLNLDYPAWLDMKCLEKDWSLTTEQSGIVFNQLLSSLGAQVGVMQRKILSSIDKRTWNMYFYNV